jgi:hypothetical protein
MTPPNVSPAGTPAADASPRPGGPLSPWLVAVVFLLLVAAILVCKRPRPEPAQASWTVDTLVEHVRRADPTLYLVLVCEERGTYCGVYFCTRQRSREELQGLRRMPRFAGHWKGVVFADRLGPEWNRVDTDGWGENGLVIGEVLLFGDPEMLEHIRGLLP